jgi:saccharopine dehydrogenase-like NADP-dependent oxidoreductase
LVIGGYGVFGSRLIRLLADEKDLTLLVAGRSKSKAEAFCRSITGRAKVLPEFIDRDAEITATIEGLHPHIVVDAAGPFQNYGADAYRIAESALSAGADYIDLADATDFVCSISRLDRLARERGRFIISGASTCPALTAAVVRHLATDMTGIQSIEAGIAPSPRVEVGLSVFRALTSYAGRPLRLLKSGSETEAIALVESLHHVIAPAGAKALDSRLFSLVDVPTCGSCLRIGRN